MAPASGNLAMFPTRCAICEQGATDKELYPAALPANAATFERFSARRLPDRVHYRIVRCENCGLVRSDPILPQAELARLYKGSSFTYANIARYASDTYARYLSQCLPLLPSPDRLLEIGCGDGSFLERALAAGFAEVYGVEPSDEAIQHATSEMRPRIWKGLFQEGIYPDGYFSLICAFQLFDHVAEPNAVLRACRRALRPGGVLLFLNHDVAAWTNRFLGERSPVIDIEHIYLYSRKTMARIFRKNGFEVVRLFAARNTYPLHYWLRMTPLPQTLKRRILPRLERSGVGRLPLSFWAGNLGIIARAPGGGS